MKAFALSFILAVAVFFGMAELNYTFLGLEFAPIFVIGRSKDKKEDK